jgi:hypothetical protein
VVGEYDAFEDLYGIRTHQRNSHFLAFEGNDIYGLNKNNLRDEPYLICEDMVEPIIFGAASTT